MLDFWRRSRSKSAMRCYSGYLWWWRPDPSCTLFAALAFNFSKILIDWLLGASPSRAMIGVYRGGLVGEGWG